MTYFIIEHPTRGILKDDSEYQEPRFSPTNNRSDERNWRAFSVNEAREGMARYLTPKLYDECRVLRAPNRAPNGRAWLRMTMAQRSAAVEWRQVQL